MDFSTGEISTLVFKRRVIDGQRDFSLDHRMLTVFLELDGRANLGTVARKAGFNMSSMREIISRLLNLQLIEKVEEHFFFLDKDFIKYLFGQYSLAVGPIAEVLIEDEVQNFGYDLSRFPVQWVSELVDRLYREIRRKEKKIIFKNNMMNKLREKGYLDT